MTCISPAAFVLDSAGPGYVILAGPSGQGSIFLQQLVEHAQRGPSAIKAFLSSLIGQGVLKFVYDIRTKNMYMYYGQDQVVANYCPFWTNVQFPPPSITVGGIVIPIYGLCGLKPNFHQRK